MTGTNTREAAPMRAESVSIRSHQQAAKPRQCLIRGSDCDSCCRGFESHQPPQIPGGLRAHKSVATPARNSHHGNTRRPAASRRRRCCIPPWMSRRAVFEWFPYCTKIQVVNRPAGIDNSRAQEALSSCAPQTAQVVSPAGRGVQQEGAFCISGRCFVVVQACGADAAGSSPIEPSNALEASSEGRPFAGPIAGISSGRHHKASSSSGRALTQQTGMYRPHPGQTADRDWLPVLTPHAPSRKRTAIYRGPERGMNPPIKCCSEIPNGIRLVAGGSSSSTPSRPTVADDSASKPQVGGLTSDRPSAGQCPLVKARSTASPPAVRVGRFYGVGVVRPSDDPQRRKGMIP